MAIGVGIARPLRQAQDRWGGVLDLAGSLSRQTTLALNYRHGPRESTLTNFRIAQEERRWSGNLRRPSWNLHFGNQVTSGGSALTGPFVRGQGVHVRRAHGLLVGELTAVQPTTFRADPAGHLLRGNVGLSGRRGRLLATISDFGRPAGGYSTAPIYPEDIDPEVLEQLERERRTLQDAARNRVQGTGVDAELRLAGVQRRRAGTVHGGAVRSHQRPRQPESALAKHAAFAAGHPAAR